MSSKLCILQMADQGPAESTALMLRAVGYDARLPNDALRQQLRDAGCDTVLDPKGLTRSQGYDPVDVPEVGPEAMGRCAVYADVKAHRNCAKVVERWPCLKGKVLWTRINGAAPEIKPGAGDEVNLCCPILTPDLWYAGDPSEPAYARYWQPDLQPAGPNWGGMAYACWPPFARFGEYQRPRNVNGFTAPVCLIHNLRGWGYELLAEPFRKLGVKLYGSESPDGLVRHREVPGMLRSTLCMVHLKSNDAPGYALYEALASACPVVCTRRIIWRCKMQSLLIPGETCLVFDRETHAGLTPEDIEESVREVGEHLTRLRDPVENRKIGEAGRKRLQEVMWSSKCRSEVESLREFMVRHFGN